MSVEDRLKQLQEAHHDFGPASQHFLSSKFFELIDIFNIWLHWRLTQELSALHGSLWPEAQEFPFPPYYLPLCLFPGVFHLHSSAGILTGVPSLGITAVSCWDMTPSLFAFFSACVCYKVWPVLLQILCIPNHIWSSSALVPCLLGWHKGSAGWILCY